MAMLLTGSFLNPFFRVNFMKLESYTRKLEMMKRFDFAVLTNKSFAKFERYLSILYLL